MKSTSFDKVAGVLVAASFALAGILQAQQTAPLLSYQGRAVVGGVNFNGPAQLRFALVSSDGSTTYWSNDGSNLGTVPGGSEPQPFAGVTLAVTNGLYSVLLGDVTLTNMTAIPVSVFTNADVRLRVWFNDGALGSELLTPDERISAVGYAVTAGSAATAQTVSNGAIGPAQLAPNAVGAAQLALNSIGSAQIASGAVGTAQLGAGAVTAANLANGSVGGAQLAAGAVGATQLAASSVGTTQIIAGAVGTAQLGAGVVTASNIANGSVGSAQLAMGAVGASQLGANSVGSTQIAAGAIGATQLAANSVATNNIADGNVTITKLAIRSVGMSAGAGGIAQSASNGDTFTTSSTTDVPVVSVTLVTTGRPVFVCLSPAAGGQQGTIGGYSSTTGDFYANFDVYRDGQLLSNTTVHGRCNNAAYNVVGVPPGSVIFFDLQPAAGSHTYQLQVAAGVSSTTVFVDNVVLTAFEF